MKKQILSITVSLLMAFALYAPTLALDETTPTNNTDGTTEASTLEERKALKQQRIEAIKQKNAARKAQILQDVCEKKTEILSDKIEHLSKQVQKHKEVFDKIYARSLEFYTDRGTNVSNFDELKTDADAAKLNAEAAIETLESFDFEVDCSSPSVGDQLANYKEATKEARDALKEYRKAIIKFVKAVKDAIKAEDTSEGAAE